MAKLMLQIAKFYIFHLTCKKVYTQNTNQVPAPLQMVFEKKKSTSNCELQLHLFPENQRTHHLWTLVLNLT